LATKEMTGEIRAEIGDMPPAIGSNIKIKMIVPYCRMMLANSMYRFGGSMPPRIFSPSRGKTGTKLKIASEMFVTIRMVKASANIPIPGTNRLIIDITSARVRLEIGPMRAISAESLLGERRL
jgi:hypothetical protein